MNLLLYEGLECTGKTTLKDRISPKIHDRWLSVERWIHSHIVYQYLLDCRSKEKLFDFVTTGILAASPFENVVLVIMEVDYQTLLKRYLALGKDLTPMLKPDYDYEKQCYRVSADLLRCVDWIVVLDGTERLDVLSDTLESILDSILAGAEEISQLKFSGLGVIRIEKRKRLKFLERIQ
jgi:thymidylate kinase